MMNYEDLDETTRKWMLEEFNTEQSQDHYQSKSMNQTGLAAFPDIMRTAIQNGNIESLTKDLSNPSFWNPSKTRRKKDGSTTSIPIKPEVEAKMVAHSEFNTMYTRGFARRLKEEGEENCEIYRADRANEPRCECSKLEGTTQPVQKIYDGHRAKYFPKDDFGAFSIPSVVFCHHTIRRVKKK